MGNPSVVAVLKRFADDIHQADRVLRLSIDGLLYISKMGPLVEALVNYEEVSGSDTVDSEPDIESARKRAEFAQQEIDSGFPVLYSQAVVACWGFIEATVEDLVVSLLMTEPQHLTHEQFRRIQIPLAEYGSLEPDERMRFLVKEFARKNSAGLKQGVSIFETLLGSVGLSGSVNEMVRRDLFELYHVRNVIVHRSGIADRRICEACPWLNLSPGQRVLVRSADYTKYSWAINEYFIDILERDLVRTGTAPDVAKTRMAPHHYPRPISS